MVVTLSTGALSRVPLLTISANGVRCRSAATKGNNFATPSRGVFSALRKEVDSIDGDASLLSCDA